MATAAAKRYARAVFELASEERDVEDWSKRLAQLSEVLADRTIAAVLTNPTIPSERRMELVESANLDPDAANLVKLLIDSDRVRDIDDIVEEYQRLADYAAGRVRATVTTAVDLDRAGRQRIEEMLSARFAKEFTVDFQTEPRILGGLKLQYGDRLIDASVATRLQQLRRRLTDAS